MPWKALLNDRDVQKSVIMALIPLIRYAPPLINHFRLRRIEKKLDGVLHDPHQTVQGRKKSHFRPHRRK